MLSPILKNHGPGSADTSGKQCLIRWEITHKCGLGCKHCFIDRDTTRPDLPYSDCLKILGSFREFLRSNNLDGKILFTGGDPLLRPDFMDILEIAKEYREAGAPISQISIHGNPAHLTAETAGRLKERGVAVYVMSLEGSRSYHDFIRQPGSFRQTLDALKLLAAAGLPSAVRLTISRNSAPEIIEIISQAVEAGAGAMNIALLLPAGRGEKLKDDALSSLEYRPVLVNIINFLDSLDERYLRLKTSLLSGEPLFARVFYELGRWDEYVRTYGPRITVGPMIAGICFVVLPDGTVQPRTLIPVKIGKMPGDSFQGIYESSGLLRSLEREPFIAHKKQEFAKCRACPVVDYCIECGPGYVGSGSAYGPDPGCWVEPG
ncbi:MAG: radical SAM protein [Planctomycetes bacterium]|nr:radical SAM protein [Planctomycetota bacterium]